jgi:zinc protease
LAEGKAGLLAQRRLARAQDAVLARGWTRHLEFNRSYAYSGQIDAALAGLTLEQVNAALRKHIDPARWVVGVGGDFKQP